MEEVLTNSVSQPVADKADKPSSDRIYIMDRRAPSEQQQKECPDPAAQATLHPHRARRVPSVRRGRLLIYALASAAGIAAGAAAAYLSPLSAESFSHALVMSEDGGFMGMLLRRMGQCGAFLAVEYIVGYFAAGGMLVWLAPLVYALGTGLSAAGAVMLGGDLMSVVFSVIYTAVLICAADTSGEFSSLLLRLVSGRNTSVITDGAAAYHYTLKFSMYAGLLLLFAITEAGIRAAGA